MGEKTLGERVLDLEQRIEGLMVKVERDREMIEKLYRWSRGARHASEIALMKRMEKGKK